MSVRVSFVQSIRGHKPKLDCVFGTKIEKKICKSDVVKVSEYPAVVFLVACE